jgi:hypothetical protein
MARLALAMRRARWAIQRRIERTALLLRSETVRPS